MPPVTTPDGDPRGPLTCDPAGPLVAEVVKTTTDPYVGRISLVRVFSGTLRPDSTVHVSGHFLGRPRPRGPRRRREGRRDHLAARQDPAHRRAVRSPATSCAVAKLGRAETGDTLSAKDDPLLMEPWLMPDPLLPVAIVAKSKADEDKLSQGLGRLVAEDPTLRLENNSETHQLVLWCMGEAHLDVLLDRLRNRYGVDVESVPVRVQLRETFAGHGQRARPARQAVRRPRPVRRLRHRGRAAARPAAGFEFVDKVVGGAVPRQFIPSVEKGVRTQMERGVAAGYPVVDIRVTLTDGKAHSVDSSDMAFQTAGALALKEAAKATTVHMLEPVDELSVLVSDEYVGAVMSDLSTRRGRVTGTEPVGSGRSLVKAEVPQVEITRYAVDLRSLSHGTGDLLPHLRPARADADPARRQAAGRHRATASSENAKESTDSPGPMALRSRSPGGFWTG